MKSFLKGLSSCISMFTIIPTKNYWEEGSLSFVAANLSLVGFFIGVLWYGFVVCLLYFNVNIVLLVGLSMVFPMFITGFIHIDGYMDTCDALSSQGDILKMQSILKDSHIGAFSVIYLTILMLLSYCALYVFIYNSNDTKVLIFIPIISRSIAGLLLLNFGPIAKEGFASTFRKNTNIFHSIFIVFILLVTFISSLLVLDIKTTLILIMVGVIGFFVGRHLINKLGGICGDICGCVIVIIEFLLLLFLA